MLCLLLADDLTGACDAAVQFAMRGYVTRVPLGLDVPLPEADVIAISTDSRGLEPDAIRDAIVRVARLGLDTPRILFKKIDSTLRGHPGVEVSTALDAFGCDRAIVCPAFPRMKRMVRSGFLCIEGDSAFAPIHVETAVPGVVSDAECDGDLDRVVADGLRLKGRVLWAGSAGLASALARTLPCVGPACAPVVRPGTLLFCIGSNHPVTLAQQAALIEQRNQHRVMRVPYGQMTAAQFAGLPPSAIVLSGGDTAALFCRTTGVQRIDLCAEIVDGIPCGILRGGLFDGVPVATKSGGFGERDALIQVADYFACSKLR